LLKRGVRLRSSSEAELLRTTKVKRILRPFRETMSPADPVGQVMRQMLSGSMAHQYVVDADDRLLGVITLRRLKAIYTEVGLDDQLLVAADIMKSPVQSVTPDDTLDVAMSLISRLDVEMLPVVDADNHLVGTVTRHDIMVFFEHEVLKDNALGLKFVPAGRPDDALFVEVPEGHVVELIDVTPFLAGRTLRDLDLRATSGLNVLGIRRKTSEGVERVAPDPGRPLVLSEVMVVEGEQRAITSFRKAIS
ncbi:MAG: CBS domain-containing protein, partial [Deltaproteobacteria bacterium]|nr:CBS domain-containing protein [Deltaproteobacteria bacterium]